jgi:hypothetical protein
MYLDIWWTLSSLLHAPWLGRVDLSTSFFEVFITTEKLQKEMSGGW